jgi:hypothetical protein
MIARRRGRGEMGAGVSAGGEVGGCGHAGMAFRHQPQHFPFGLDAAFPVAHLSSPYAQTIGHYSCPSK